MLVPFNPQTSDNVGVTSTVCVPASGSVFHAFDTVVNCTDYDAAGNHASCLFTVTVQDQQPPTIICPATSFADTDPGSTYGSFNWTLPSVANGTASDNVGVSTVICSRNTEDFEFPLGTTTVSCTVTDTSNNQAFCSFTVKIVDKEPPVVTCPISQNIIINPPATSANALTLFFTPADNVAVAGIAVTKNGIPVNTTSFNNTYDMGVTSFVETVTDTAGNTASCSWTVGVYYPNAVLDFTPPSLVCPNQTIYYGSLTYGSTSGKIVFPTVSYNHTDVARTGYLFSPPKVSDETVFPLGSTQVTFQAFDISNNVASCTYTVVMLDTEPPRIVCPSSFSLWANPPLTFSTVTWTAPVISDNIGILSTTVSRDPGVYNAGFYDVLCITVDTSGNTANCSFSFSVLTELSSPTVQCPSSLVRNTTAGFKTAKVSWPLPSISDAKGIASAVYSPETAVSGSIFPLGITNVQLNVTNIYGHSTVCNFRIVVQDKEKPRWVTCGTSQNYTLNKDQVNMSIYWPTPIAADNVAIATFSVTQPNQTLFGLGIYHISADAVDTSGNVAETCEFTIEVLPFVAASTNALASAISPGLAGGAAAGFIFLLLLIAFILIARERRVS